MKNFIKNVYVCAAIICLQTQLSIIAAANVQSCPVLGQQLIHASAAGEFAVVQDLINKKADINFKDAVFDFTPLIYAAERGRQYVAELLIAAGADIDARDKNGNTALIYAAERGYADIVKRFISAGAQVNVSNNDGDSPLKLAARNGHVGVIELLLAAGARVDSKDAFGDTPLMGAAEKGYKEAVVSLLIAGAHVNEANEVGDTAFTLAAKKGHQDIVELLIQVNRPTDLAVYRHSEN